MILAGLVLVSTNLKYFLASFWKDYKKLILANDSFRQLINRASSPESWLSGGKISYLVLMQPSFLNSCVQE